MDNSTRVAFSGDDAPQNIVISMSISLCVFVMLFFVHAYCLVKVLIAYARTNRAKSLEILRLLVGQLTFTWLLCIWASVVAATKKSVQTCYYLGSAGPFAYGMSFVFGYLILLNRAKAVNEWVQTKCFNALYSNITLAVYGVAAFSVAACFLLRGKTFFKQQYCALVPISPVIALIMLVMDSLLSFTLFFLFAGPMIARLKINQNNFAQQEEYEVDNETSILRKAARRNFWISSVQILSTFVALIIVFVLTEIVANSADPEMQVLNMITLFIGPIDTSINVACSLAMVRKVWLQKSKTQVAPRSGSRSSRRSPFVKLAFKRTSVKASVV